MNTPVPIIFLAFANEYEGGRYLHKLVEEQKQLYAALGPVSSNENADDSKNILCELVVRQNATIQDIFDVFQKYEGRIAIFHYGGHADGYQLLLQGKEGESKIAHAGGLVTLLSRKKNLKLVFLNGCSTQKFAQDLTTRGVPAVIGTAVSIPDDTALQISSRFYNGLARGLTMAGAWEEAKAEAITGADPNDTHRGFQLRAAETDRFPWDVEFRDDAAKEIFNSWNLPGVANQPLFGLPDPPKQKLPPSPFLFLKPYTSDHAEIFFGRSYYIRDLYLKINEPNSPPIILLYGESGAGKSSLLDAGLQPRLVAAADPNTGETLFDVRYQRRDQDLGLIGTLAEMLSYYTETSAEAEAGAAAKPEKDPNLEKIQAIESLAKELEEETASSFLSLVERYRAVRTYQSSKEHRHNLYRTGDLDKFAGAQLREAWLNIEKKSGRRLVIILDQVEELFTRSNPKMERELEDLLQVLTDIFGAPAENADDRIKGKIILGYREEFNAKMEARIKEYGLSRSTVFLEQLNRKDILDIFQGLESGVVKDHYNITIEESLPEHVANQLLAGKESVAPGQRPVAPVLQLLLTKLWNKAYRDNSHQPAFTIDAFNEVESQGKEMEEYFETQMKKIQEWKSEVVESGLALDILAFHITDLGTSKRCAIEDIRRRYRHLAEQTDQPDIVDQLVNRLKSSEIFLLNDIGRGFTSLPHDTLAPIIMREYNRSDKLGQRSARILDTKRPDFIRALLTKDERKVRLDDNDLEVVKGGIRGMRALEEEEKTLLQISMEEREKRLKLRRILVRGGIVAGLFILFLAVMAGMLSVSVTQQLKNVAIDRAHQASLKQQDNPDKENYTTPEDLAHFSYKSQGDDMRLQIVQNYYKLLGPYINSGVEMDPANTENVRPVSLSLRPGARISSMNYYPKTGPLVSLEDGLVKFWPGGLSENERVIDVKKNIGDWFGGEVDPTFYNKLNASFSADGEYIQVLFRYDRQPLYVMDGKLVPAPTLAISIKSNEEEGYYEGEEDAEFMEEELAEDEGIDQVIGVPIGYYDLFAGKFVDDFGLSYSEKDFLWTYGPDNLLVDGEPYDVTELFSYKLIDEGRGIFLDSAYQDLKAESWEISNAPLLNSVIQLSRANTREGKELKIPLRATKNLVRGSFNSCLVLDPGYFQEDSITRGLFYPEFLDYLSALTPGSFLTVSTDGGAAILDAAGNVMVPLLPAGSGILDIGLSPDNKYFHAVTKDSVVIWNLNGARKTAYPHANIRTFSYSVDGARLLSLSPDKVRIWTAGDNATKEYAKGPEDNPIVLARFHEDGLHLVIGLNSSGGLPGKGILSFLKKKGNRKDARIDFWNIESGKVDRSFQAECPQLTDASISADGRFAVALDPGKATVIPAKDAKTRRREYNADGIEPLLTGEEENTAGQRIFLSANGTYIVRQSLSGTDNRIELFNRNGMPVKAYSFQSYNQGFNGELFTPDDHYLIAHKSDEVFYWHPDDGSINWPPVPELDLGEKQRYGLATFIDYIPGTGDTAKWWAIGLLLLCLVYALLFFSGAIIEFVQRKSYLELGLYGVSFGLFTLLLVAIWVDGSEDAVMKKTAFYGLIWGTLGILGLSIYRNYKNGKPRNNIALAVVALLLLVGTGSFFIQETNNHKEYYKIQLKDYARAIQDDYPYYKPIYDSLYLVVLEQADRKIPDSVSLTKEELRVFAEKLPPVGWIAQPKMGREWPVLWGLLIFALFIGLMGYPIFRALGKYREGDRRSFYRWLYLPTGFVAFSFWLVFAGLLNDGYGFNSGKYTFSFSAGLAAIGIALAIYHKSRQYLKAQKLGTWFVYGLPTFFIVSLLTVSMAVLPLGLAIAFIYGWESRRRKSFGKAFLFFSGGLFLAFGGIWYSLLSQNYWMLLGLALLAPVLVLMYYGLRMQLLALPLRKAAGKSRMPNRLAILGLWLLGFMATGFFSDEMLSATISADPVEVPPTLDESQEYYEEQSDTTATSFADAMAGYPVWQADSSEVNGQSDFIRVEEGYVLEMKGEQVVAEFEVRDETAEYLEVYDDSRQLTLRLFETEALFQNAGDTEWKKVFDGKWIIPEEQTGMETGAVEMTEEAPAAEEAPAEADAGGTGELTDLQQLVMSIFDADEQLRNEARKQLSRNPWAKDPELIPELVQAGYDNASVNEGVWNTLYIMEKLSDDQLSAHQDLLRSYLDWMSQRGYGSSTMKRVGDLQARIGG
ncbi:MAG: CHAT domain-containing protein [Saprospirales bacterium]|nr:CHAT domain-containing protein [Saprospirales bacterium]